jgi:hypothetical protein
MLFTQLPLLLKVINVMDIFTTQLTRVVPVPIKPVSLKVKALLKDEATTRVKEDHDHLENHNDYFDNSEKQGEQYHADDNKKGKEGNSEQQSPEKNESLINAPIRETSTQASKLKTEAEKTVDKDQHLDLYA